VLVTTLYSDQALLVALPSLDSTLVALGSCWLGLNLLLGCAKEFMRVARAFALLAPISSSS
jgi:hypothetical protein